MRQHKTEANKEEETTGNQLGEQEPTRRTGDIPANNIEPGEIPGEMVNRHCQKCETASDIRKDKSAWQWILLHVIPLFRICESGSHHYKRVDYLQPT